MWKKGRMLAACMFAMAWWSIFYPELCFTEGTYETVETVEADEAGTGVNAQDAGMNMAFGILRAKDDEIVISSRLFEWCEERLFDRKE